MILTKTINALAGVYTASVSVTVDPLETDYFSTYGEPRVDLAGTFTYIPEVPQVSLAIALTPGDIGTVTVPGTVSYNAGLAGYELTASGQFTSGVANNPGLFYRNDQVIGDWQFVMRIDHVQDVVAPNASNGMLIGIGCFTGAGDQAPGFIFGWGGSQEAPAIEVRQRTTQGGNLTKVAGIARASSHGILLKAVRTSDNVALSYSLDNGVTYTTLTTVTIALAGVVTGLFFNSGLTTAGYAIVTQLSFQTLPASAPNSFVITGSPQLAYLRSNSPHEFSLNSALDADAKAKVIGWADGIVSRITAAKTQLMARPSPGSVATSTTAQV